MLERNKREGNKEPSVTTKAREKKESGVQKPKAKRTKRTREGYSLDTLMAILDW